MSMLFIFILYFMKAGWWVLDGLSVRKKHQLIKSDLSLYSWFVGRTVVRPHVIVL